MNKKVKTVLLIMAFALLIAIAVFAYNSLSQKVSPQNNIDVTHNEDEASQTEQETEMPQTGQENATAQTEQDEETEKVEAPDFTVLDMDGNPVKLSDMFGKPVVLNFWASWCSSCKTAMPGFNEVYGEVGKI